MKFFSFPTVLSLAAVAIAAPTVEKVTLSPLTERQSTSATSCGAKNDGKLFCCQDQPSGITQNPGLLQILGIPAIKCIGVIVNLNAVCGTNTICCNGPQQVTATGLINIAPGAQVCPGVAA